tara:strand:+ start:328 stop:450 length:123 start_codon:yes stop_codon:yes gene_type:complete
MQNSNGSNYDEENKNFGNSLKNNKTLTNEIEDSAGSAPMP